MRRARELAARDVAFVTAVVRGQRAEAESAALLIGDVDTREDDEAVLASAQGVG